jgi:hypothetical protein
MFSRWSPLWLHHKILKRNPARGIVISRSALWTLRQGWWLAMICCQMTCIGEGLGSRTFRIWNSTRLRVGIENSKGPTTRAFTFVKHHPLFQIRRSNSSCYSSFVAIQSSFVESISRPKLFCWKCCHCSSIECMCDFAI